MDKLYNQRRRTIIENNEKFKEEVEKETKKKEAEANRIKIQKKH